MKFEFSAGGIVFIKSNGNPKVLVCQHSQHHGWVFPKGFIGDHIKGESKEETALREVKEETGVKGKILQSLTPIEFWYSLDGDKIKKTVYYYLMEFVEGDIKDHDFEMENVEWLGKDEVEHRLTYESDKKVWQEAIRLIENRIQ